MTNNPVTEAELAGKATAPRVTVCDVEDTIQTEHYFTAREGMIGAAFEDDGPANAEDASVNMYEDDPLSLLTFCVLVLKNGFTVVGKSACASPENFDFDIGSRVAREDAVRQIWPLLGYQLRESLS